MGRRCTVISVISVISMQVSVKKKNEERNRRELQWPAMFFPAHWFQSGPQKKLNKSTLKLLI